jgi:protein-L-isoaspartate(D-aspartate) O-methyltransferase
VRDVRVLQVMEKVRRKDFLPSEAQRFERDDRPLAIGEGQTTSQPSLIAKMIEELGLKPGCKVLEVGTGSGYQTALLARLCDQVYSVEIVEPLARTAKKRLAELGYANAHVRAGDGYLGWPEAAPFDGIVVCAATARVPQPLVDQLKPGGRLVIPLEDAEGESLVVLEKNEGGELSRREVTPVRFVPLTGHRAEKDRTAD